MKYRKLRIAWSVAWGVVAVLLVVLWVRSYWFGDFTVIKYSASHQFRLVSIDGVIGSAIENPTAYNPRFIVGSEAISPNGFDWTIYHVWGNHTRLCVPHWVLAIVPGSIAAVPWLPLRFSLRTLLIAMTLVAVGLGLVVWLW